MGEIPHKSAPNSFAFCFTIAGVLIGNVFGSKFKDKATILGGIILIGIGVKILIEHLEIFG